MQKKTLKFVLMATLPSIMLFSISLPAMSGDEYRWHEHPFMNVRNDMDQSSGDSYCQNLYYQKLKEAENLRLSHFVPAKVLALSGKNITDPWHIWYHRNNGQCIANK